MILISIRCTLPSIPLPRTPPTTRAGGAPGRRSPPSASGARSRRRCPWHGGWPAALRPGSEEPTLAGAAGRPASTPPALGATDDAIMSTGRRGGAAHRAGAVGGLEPLDSRREATAGRAVQRRIVAKAPRGRTWERAVVPEGARSYPGTPGRTRGRAVVPEGARSYPGARGRTRGRAVIPGSARSYLRGALRYDHGELRTTGSAGGTTAPDYVRPRGFTYDRAGPMAHGDEAACPLPCWWFPVVGAGGRADCHGHGSLAPVRR